LTTVQVPTSGQQVIFPIQVGVVQHSKHASLVPWSPQLDAQHGAAEDVIPRQALDNPTCLRIRFENGEVAEVWEFVWDLFHVDDFWS